MSSNGDAGAGEAGTTENDRSLPTTRGKSETVHELEDKSEEDCGGQSDVRDDAKVEEVPKEGNEGMSTEEPRQGAIRYLEKHHMVSVFQTIIGRLAFERPDNPVLFMKDELERMKASGKLPDVTSTTASPSPARESSVKTTEESSRKNPTPSSHNTPQQVDKSTVETDKSD